MSTTIINKIENWFKSELEKPLEGVVLTAAHKYLVTHATATQEELVGYLIGSIDVLVASLISILPVYIKPEAVIAEPFVENFIKESIPVLVANLYADISKTV